MAEQGYVPVMYQGSTTPANPPEGALWYTDGGLRVYDGSSWGYPIPSLTATEISALSPDEGAVVYDNTNHKLKVYTGSAWETVTSA